MKTNSKNVVYSKTINFIVQNNLVFEAVLLFFIRIITLKNLNRLMKWGIPCSSKVSRRDFKHAGVTDRIHFWGMRFGTANSKDIVILSVSPDSDFSITVVENHIWSKHQITSKLGLYFTVTWLVYRHEVHVHYRSKFFLVVTLCHWHKRSWKNNVHDCAFQKTKWNHLLSIYHIILRLPSTSHKIAGCFSFLSHLCENGHLNNTLCNAFIIRRDCKITCLW